MNYEWLYYHDAKAWLCKVQKKKKTIVWMSAWNDSHRVNNIREKEMNNKQWYETLFENYGEKFDNESFVQGTIGECDFFEEEINHNKSLQIIDIGCGTGASFR